MKLKLNRRQIQKIKGDAEIVQAATMHELLEANERLTDAYSSLSDTAEERLDRLTKQELYLDTIRSVVTELDDERPQVPQGHFRITAESEMAGPGVSVIVRGSSLAQALNNAYAVPFNEWEHGYPK